MTDQPTNLPPLPPTIPMARPVSVELSYASHLAPPQSPINVRMSQLRALLEMLILIPFVIGGSQVALIIIDLAGVTDQRWTNVASAFGMGSAGILAVLVMLTLDQHKIASIGLTARDGLLNTAIGVCSLVAFYIVGFSLALVIMLILTPFIPELLTQEPESMRAIQETFPPMSLAIATGMMIVVALWEEVVFRGFLLTRLHVLVHRWWLAIPLGALLFSLGHLYQGLLGMFLTFILGIILGSLFVWRKSLVPGIVYHVLQNVIAIQMVQHMADFFPES